MARGRFGWLVAAVIVVVQAAGAAADDPELLRDVDAWHAMLADAVGGELTDEVEPEWSLGLYPSAGIALGPPDWIAYQVHGALSLSDGSSFSLFAGYGYERGAHWRSHMATLGWGGVRRLTAGRSQRGFYGKFLRYRQLDHETDGRHHGLSVGTENGVGPFAIVVEIGAARSSEDHWAVTAQIAVKLAVPFVIQL
jgi:hypothetical protein